MWFNIIVTWCFRPRFSTVKAILGRRQPGRMRWIFYEPCPWCRIDRSTCWPAVQRATTVPRMPPGNNHKKNVSSKDYKYMQYCMSHFTLEHYIIVTVLHIKYIIYVLQLYSIISNHPISYFLSLVSPSSFTNRNTHLSTATPCNNSLQEKPKLLSIVWVFTTVCNQKPTVQKHCAVLRSLTSLLGFFMT